MTDTVFVIRREHTVPASYFQGPTVSGLGRAYSWNPCYAKKYETAQAAQGDVDSGEQVVHMRMVPTSWLTLRT